MSGAATSAGALAASRRLAELLDGPYRRRWEFHARRQRAGQLNQLAIAAVLSGHLADHPEQIGDTEKRPEQLKDAIWKVVHGKGLSRDRLLLFINAFRMSDQHAEELLGLWGGHPAELGDYHTRTWPAAQKSAVWVLASSARSRAGDRHVLRFTWGRWRLTVAAPLDDRGVAFATDKDRDEGEPTPLSVGCDIPLYVQFGEHQPPVGVPVVDVRDYWVDAAALDPSRPTSDRILEISTDLLT